MSRIGKIARLPKAVREELNRRLEDGEEGKGLVAWLNGHAEVQAVLQAQYEGRAINEPNLTAWRQGGFEDWQRQQEALDVGERLVEESAALGALTQDRLLADRVAMMAALAIGEQLMAVRRMEDGAEKRRAILKLVRGLVRLRKSDREQERGQREAAQAERAREYHQDWVERMRKPKEPFAELSDGELMRRMEEMRALDTGPRGDAAAWEEEDDEGDEDEEGETRGRGDEETGGPAFARASAYAGPSAFAGPTADRTEDRTAGRAEGRRHTAFEVRGGEAHGYLARGEQARPSPQAGRAVSHETHEIHEKKAESQPIAVPLRPPDEPSIRLARNVGN